MDEKILVTGGTGLAGSAIVKALYQKGYHNLVVTYNKRRPEDCFDPELLHAGTIRFVPVNLLRQDSTEQLLQAEKPHTVFVAAARVGGIHANHQYRAQFIYENLQLQNNIIHSSYLAQVKKLLFLGSTCIYPKDAPQPMVEDCLMTDTLEYMSEPYGVAKIAGIKLCESYNLQYGTNFIAVMPTNLFGPNDNYDLNNSHFLPAFIRKMHLAKMMMEENWEAVEADLDLFPVDGLNGSAGTKAIIDVLAGYQVYYDQLGKTASVRLWGSGNPRREAMHSDSFAAACIHIMEHINFSHLAREAARPYSGGNIKQQVRNTQINIGTGQDYTIAEIARMVQQVVGFSGTITWNTAMPEGTTRKLTDTSRLRNLGWENTSSLEAGIRETYRSYLKKRAKGFVQG